MIRLFPISLVVFTSAFCVYKCESQSDIERLFGPGELTDKAKKELPQVIKDMKEAREKEEHEFKEHGKTWYVPELSPDKDAKARIIKVSFDIAPADAIVRDNAVEIIKRRLERTGIKNIKINVGGSGDLTVMIDNLDDVHYGRLKSLLMRIGNLQFRQVAPESQMDEFKGPPNAPNGYEWIKNASNGERENRNQLLCSNEAVISGKDIIQSEVEFQTDSSLSPVRDETGKVSGWKLVRSEINGFTLFIKLSGEAGVRMGKFTGSHIGYRLAIVLDNTIIQAPVIRELVLNEGAIFSPDESLVRDMKVILSAGCLPCRVVIKE
jgi:preprotein translocase subunit SecD